MLDVNEYSTIKCKMFQCGDACLAKTYWLWHKRGDSGGGEGGGYDCHFAHNKIVCVVARLWQSDRARPMCRCWWTYHFWIECDKLNFYGATNLSVLCCVCARRSSSSRQPSPFSGDIVCMFGLHCVLSTLAQCLAMRSQQEIASHVCVCVGVSGRCAMQCEYMEQNNKSIKL